MQQKRISLLLMLFLLIAASQVLAQDTIRYEGEITSDGQQDVFPLELEEGQGVIITAEALSPSNLDTMLGLIDPSGNIIAENDDYEYPRSTDSRIAFVVKESGSYVVTVTNYPNSIGNYRLTIEFVTEEDVQSVLVQTEVNTTPQRQADMTFEGTVSEGVTAQYSVQLEAGQGLIAAAYATDGLLNPILTLLNASGQVIMRNGDRLDYSSWDAQIALTAPESGEYTIIVSNVYNSPGNYRLQIYLATEAEVRFAEQSIRLVLSGAIQTYDSQNFRIHYTLEGRDAASEGLITQIAQTAEEAYQIQMDMGWRQPLRDSTQGGDERFDIYLVDLRGDPYGYASSSSPMGDNPNTEFVEASARAGYMVIDNNFTEFGNANRAMRATIAHVFNYLVQFAYDSTDLQWYMSSTASWMETVTFPEDEEASGYASAVIRYPEICFGAQDDADYTDYAIYGSWLFMEFITRELGEDIVIRLWENIAIHFSWDALEETLEDYHVTLEDMIARYHINNLLRDYAFLDGFAWVHVPLQSNINDEGVWTQTGRGVQQLAANYFEFSATPGSYALSIDANYTPLEIYGIGIRGTTAELFDLGEEGVIDNQGYDRYYLLIFNTDYHDVPNSCLYLTYELEVEATTIRADTAFMTVNAEHFEAP